MKIKLHASDYWNEYYESSKIPKSFYYFVGAIAVFLICIIAWSKHDPIILAFAPMAACVGIAIHAIGAVLYILDIVMQKSPLKEYDLIIADTGICAMDIKSGNSELVEWSMLSEKTIMASLTRYRSDKGPTFLFPHRISGVDDFIAQIDRKRV